MAADFRQTAKAHVNDNRLISADQTGPIQVRSSVFQVSGDKDASLRMITMGQRDARITGDPRRGSHAGYNFEGDAVRSQRL